MQLLQEKLKTIVKRPPLSPGEEADRELARGMLEGDTESLERFVDRHLGPLVRYLERRLGPGHEQEAGEIAHLTLADVIRRLKPYARGSARLPVQMWLVRRAESHLRKRARKGSGSRVKDGADSPERGTLEWLRDLMDDLPQRQQALISLALFEQMTPEEIGASMGLRPARAMRQLRAALLRVNTRIIAGQEADGR
jgi:RNA polymerase sigma factor (sigma-70 family)